VSSRTPALDVHDDRKDDCKDSEREEQGYAKHKIEVAHFGPSRLHEGLSVGPADQVPIDVLMKLLREQLLQF
jgi:hypothetical protein